MVFEGVCHTVDMNTGMKIFGIRAPFVFLLTMVLLGALLFVFSSSAEVGAVSGGARLYGGATIYQWAVVGVPVAFLLAFIKAVRDEVKSDVRMVRDEVKSDVRMVRDEMKNGVSMVRDEMKSDVRMVRDEMKNAITLVRDDLKSDIQMVCSRIDDLRKDVVDRMMRLENIKIIEEKSPAQLTATGQTLLRKSGGLDYITRHQQDLSGQFDGVDDPFEIQEKARQLIREKIVNKEFAVDTHYLYEKAKTIDEVVLAVGTELRDVIFRIKGMPVPSDKEEEEKAVAS